MFKRLRKYFLYSIIGHVNDIPTTKLFTGIPRKTQSKYYMLSLTEYVWEFQNNALWDILKYMSIGEIQCKDGKQEDTTFSISAYLYTL